MRIMFINFWNYILALHSILAIYVCVYICGGHRERGGIHDIIYAILIKGFYVGLNYMLGILRNIRESQKDP